MSMDVVRGEVETMGKSHQVIAGQLKQELEEPLVAFAGGLKERRKIIQSGIEKLLQTKNKQTHAVNKARDRYEQDCLKIKGYLAQGHMVMGQEERKNKAKLEKTQVQMSATSQEYEQAVKFLEETTGRWNREWKAACDVSQVRFMDANIADKMKFRNSKTWKRNALILPRAVFGASPTSHRLPALVTMHRARRFVFHLRTAMWKRTSPASSRSKAPAKKSQTRLNTSTSAEETCLTMYPRLRTMAPIPLHSLRGR